MQDFSSYTLIADVRPRAEYENDHVPGAVHIELADPLACESLDAASDPPAELMAAMKSVRWNRATLIYCGHGGRISETLAKTLRWRGWTVDVIPGGWINYRRWVQAGLEELPRLVTFRVISSSLRSEAVRVLRALRKVGHEVLDVEGIAAARRGELGSSSEPQPAQALFESELLHKIRGLDPRVPVWVTDCGARIGALEVPGALRDALATVPIGMLQVDVMERVKRWQEDEPLLQGRPADILRAFAGMNPPPDQALLAKWDHLAAKGSVDQLVADVLTDYIDPVYAEASKGRSVQRKALPPLIAASLEPSALAAAVWTWVSVPISGSR